ncbi:hypothetical protein LNKW23_06990 [Paralimibaculum aggregatum]|uniref:Uncharacterized protein n=1 Tax=Paralimibaculum aggregatum TaxID=3036245 RepID=A0ABQ6LM28_9RHOB|nr:hypothetical protein [Limibaculum sp. NKW23]GMG81486.1 hypothetical protein LNKW23_06990 [Limibaculum sp. NKW23]
MSLDVDGRSVAQEAADYEDRYGVTPARADHATLLRMIEDLLNEGLQTLVEPFPETDREFAAILDELRALSPDQLRAKLVISGWLLRPYGEDQMRCQECMYFLVHRRWCDLPELNLPAEPEWWCRLWRI